MSTIPPPPMPPAMPDVKSSVKPVVIAKATEPSIDPNICQWASEYPELRESCIRNRICINQPPFSYKYKRFESISQVGPTCGLVALSMLVNGDVTPDVLLIIAKSEGFTTIGEMFSCKQMFTLAQIVKNLIKMHNVTCTLRKGGLFSPDIIEMLLDGAILLVPYDTDYNHSPCLKNGHTAHWALVCGIIVLEDAHDAKKQKDNIYVLCKHGKSNYLAIWKLYDLAKSNTNLWELSPKKEQDGLAYTLPVGGIGGENGLRDKFLVFEGL